MAKMAEFLPYKMHMIPGRNANQVWSYWDDLRFPSSGLNPPGQENAPTLDNQTGLFVFPNNSTRLVSGLAQMPHAWREGTAIRPHVHWVQPAAGNVLWRLEYRLMPAVRGEFPSEWTTVQSAEAVSEYPGEGNWVQITSFPEIDMTGFRLSAMVLFRVARVGGDALDTLNQSVSLLEFDIHHRVSSPGSRQEFRK